MRHRRWAAVAVAVLLATTACSDDEPSGEGTTKRMQPSSSKGTSRLEGAIAAHGDFELQYPLAIGSCEELLTASSYVVPLPSLLGTTQLQWQASLVGLKGAGTYGIADLAAFELIATTEGQDPVEFVRGDDTQALLVLKNDGGGEFTFSGLHDADGEELHGTSTWRCGPRG